MTTYPEHPAAALLPLLPPGDLERLAEDIKANGLQEPIVLHAGQILDGRNRLAACALAGVEPRYREHNGDDPIGYVLSANIHRRHLTTGQRAMVAVAMLPELETRARVRQGARTDLWADLPGGGGEHRARDEAARMVGCSPRSVADAKRLAAELPAAAAEVRAGTRSLNDGMAELRDPRRYRRNKELEEDVGKLADGARRIRKALETSRAVSRSLNAALGHVLAYRAWETEGYPDFRAYAYVLYGEELFPLLSKLVGIGGGLAPWIAAELGVPPADPEREPPLEQLADTLARVGDLRVPSFPTDRNGNGSSHD